MAFGYHLVLDGYNCNKDRLSDKERIVNFINKLVISLGMTKLSPIEVYFTTGNDKKDPGGYSAFVVIMESHIALHTFIGTGFITADVYTCADSLPAEQIIKAFQDEFGFTEYDHNSFKRGVSYPHFSL